MTHLNLTQLNNRNDYNLQKSYILKKYQQWIDRSDLLKETKVFNLESLKEWQKNLEQEKFVVAVCGQMKAGKSSLLNALIFDDIVLPVDDNVMTAKITIISYDQNPHLEIEFFSKNEWNEVAKDYSSFQSASAEIIKEKVKEISLKEKISIVNIDQFVSTLNQYVATVEQGGIYSPIVKSIRLYYPIEKLKGIDIVDTPGINDPNPMRTKITTNWISQADAVIYVSYAGQAIADADEKFIRKHLGGINPEKKILVVNKIDVVKKLDEVKSFIETLKDSKSQELQALVSNYVSYVSSGAYLVRATKNHQDRHSSIDDLAYVFKKNPQFATLNDGMQDLTKLIDERLISNKGRDILKIHQSHMDFFKKEVLEYIQSGKDLLGFQQELQNKTIEELNALNEKLNSQLKYVNDILEKFYENLNQDINNLNLEIDGELKKFQTKLFKQIEEDWISKKIEYKIYLEIEDLIFPFLQIFQLCWQKELKVFYDYLKKMKDTLNKYMENHIGEIKKDLFQVTIGDFQIDFKEINENIRKYSINQLDQIIDGIKTFDPRTSLSILDKGGEIVIFDDTLNKFKNTTYEEVQKVFGRFMGNVIENAKGDLSKISSDVRHEVEKSTNKIIQNRKKMIEEQIKNKENQLQDGDRLLREREAILQMQEAQLLEMLQD
jgi:predicted GTPase